MLEKHASSGTSMVNNHHHHHFLNIKNLIKVFMFMEIQMSANYILGNFYYYLLGDLLRIY